MIPVHVIGMGLGPEDLTARHHKIISQAQILAGGRRHLACFKDHPAEKKRITRDMRGLIRHIRIEMREKLVVVLASGDPNFFGIAPLLVESLGTENVVIHPNISSVAAAFSRIKERWDDAVVVSLHGRRPENSFLDAVAASPKVVLFTDSKTTPAWLARQLIKAGHEQARMCVLENLGAPDEHVAWYLPAEAANRTFAALNVVVVRKSLTPDRDPALPLDSNGRLRLQIGMPEGCYLHETELITKAEVRAVSISKLRLWPGLTLWDLGAGSGSVAIEASLLLRGGKVIALEQDPQRISHIRQNRKRFKVRNLEIVQARLPDGLEGLSPPDRIFIGGGGKDLLPIIKAAAGHLKPGAVMVVNTILLASLDSAMTLLKRLGFAAEVIQVQVSRGRTMPFGERLEALNPVWIVSGLKLEKGL